MNEGISSTRMAAAYHPLSPTTVPEKRDISIEASRDQVHGIANKQREPCITCDHSYKQELKHVGDEEEREEGVGVHIEAF